jgi:hypothetical protein
MLITGQAGVQGLRDGVSAAADAARGAIGLAGSVAAVQYDECGRARAARGSGSRGLIEGGLAWRKCGRQAGNADITGVVEVEAAWDKESKRAMVAASGSGLGPVGSGNLADPGQLMHRLRWFHSGSGVGGGPSCANPGLHRTAHSPRTYCSGLLPALLHDARNRCSSWPSPRLVPSPRLLSPVDARSSFVIPRPGHRCSRDAAQGLAPCHQIARSCASLPRPTTSTPTTPTTTLLLPPTPSTLPLCT